MSVLWSAPTRFWVPHNDPRGAQSSLTARQMLGVKALEKILAFLFILYFCLQIECSRCKLFPFTFKSDYSCCFLIFTQRLNRYSPNVGVSGNIYTRKSYWDDINCKSKSRTVKLNNPFLKILTDCLKISIMPY